MNKEEMKELRKEGKKERGGREIKGGRVGLK